MVSTVDFVTCAELQGVHFCPVILAKGYAADLASF